MLIARVLLFSCILNFVASCSLPNTAIELLSLSESSSVSHWFLSFVSAADVSLLQSGFTTSIWVRISMDPSAPSLATEIPLFGSFDSSAYQSLRVVVNSSSQELAMRYETGSALPDLVSASYPVLSDVWHHVAVVVDPTVSAVRMYVDGVARTSIVASAGALTASLARSVRVGCAGWESSDAVCSAVRLAVDDLRVYVRALSASDVYTLATVSAVSRWDVRDAALSLYAPFDALNGSVTAAVDSFKGAWVGALRSSSAVGSTTSSVSASTGGTAALVLGAPRTRRVECAAPPPACGVGGVTADCRGAGCAVSVGGGRWCACRGASSGAACGACAAGWGDAGTCSDAASDVVSAVLEVAAGSVLVGGDGDVDVGVLVSRAFGGAWWPTGVAAGSLAVPAATNLSDGSVAIRIAYVSTAGGVSSVDAIASLLAIVQGGVGVYTAASLWGDVSVRAGRARAAWAAAVDDGVDQLCAGGGQLKVLRVRVGGVVQECTLFRSVSAEDAPAGLAAPSGGGLFSNSGDWPDWWVLAVIVVVAVAVAAVFVGVAVGVIACLIARRDAVIAPTDASDTVKATSLRRSSGKQLFSVEVEDGATATRTAHLTSSRPMGSSEAARDVRAASRLPSPPATPTRSRRSSSVALQSSQTPTARSRTPSMSRTKSRRDTVSSSTKSRSIAADRADVAFERSLRVSNRSSAPLRHSTTSSASRSLSPRSRQPAKPVPRRASAQSKGAQFLRRPSLKSPAVVPTRSTRRASNMTHDDNESDEYPSYHDDADGAGSSSQSSGSDSERSSGTSGRSDTLSNSSRASDDSAFEQSAARLAALQTRSVPADTLTDPSGVVFGQDDSMSASRPFGGRDPQALALSWVGAPAQHMLSQLVPAEGVHESLAGVRLRGGVRGVEVDVGPRPLQHSLHVLMQTISALQREWEAAQHDVSGVVAGAQTELKSTAEGDHDVSRWTPHSATAACEALGVAVGVVCDRYDVAVRRQRSVLAAAATAATAVAEDSDEAERLAASFAAGAEHHDALVVALLREVASAIAHGSFAAVGGGESVHLRARRDVVRGLHAQLQSHFASLQAQLAATMAADAAAREILGADAAALRDFVMSLDDVSAEVLDVASAAVAYAKRLGDGPHRDAPPLGDSNTHAARSDVDEVVPPGTARSASDGASETSDGGGGRPARRRRAALDESASDHDARSADRSADSDRGGGTHADPPAAFAAAEPSSSGAGEGGVGAQWASAIATLGSLAEVIRRRISDDSSEAQRGVSRSVVAASSHSPEGSGGGPLPLSHSDRKESAITVVGGGGAGGSAAALLDAPSPLEAKEGALQLPSPAGHSGTIERPQQHLNEASVGGAASADTPSTAAAGTETVAAAGTAATSSSSAAVERIDAGQLLLQRSVFVSDSSLLFATEELERSRLTASAGAFVSATIGLSNLQVEEATSRDQIAEAEGALFGHILLRCTASRSNVAAAAAAALRLRDALTTIEDDELRARAQVEDAWADGAMHCVRLAVEVSQADRAVRSRFSESAEAALMAIAAAEVSTRAMCAAVVAAEAQGRTWCEDAEVDARSLLCERRDATVALLTQTAAVASAWEPITTTTAAPVSGGSSSVGVGVIGAVASPLPLLGDSTASPRKGALGAPLVVPDRGLTVDLIGQPVMGGGAAVSAAAAGYSGAAQQLGGSARRGSELGGSAGFVFTPPLQSPSSAAAAAAAATAAAGFQLSLQGDAAGGAAPPSIAALLSTNGEGTASATAAAHQAFGAEHGGSGSTPGGLSVASPFGALCHPAQSSAAVGGVASGGVVSSPAAAGEVRAVSSSLPTPATTPLTASSQVGVAVARTPSMFGGPRLSAARLAPPLAASGRAGTLGGVRNSDSSLASWGGGTQPRTIHLAASPSFGTVGPSANTSAVAPAASWAWTSSTSVRHDPSPSVAAASGSASRDVHRAALMAAAARYDDAAAQVRSVEQRIHDARTAYVEAASAAAAAEGNLQAILQRRDVDAGSRVAASEAAAAAAVEVTHRVAAVGIVERGLKQAVEARERAAAAVATERRAIEAAGVGLELLEHVAHVR